MRLEVEARAPREGERQPAAGRRDRPKSQAAKSTLGSCRCAGVGLVSPLANFEGAIGEHRPAAVLPLDRLFAVRSAVVTKLPRRLGWPGSLVVVDEGSYVRLEVDVGGRLQGWKTTRKHDWEAEGRAEHDSSSNDRALAGPPACYVFSWYWYDPLQLHSARRWGRSVPRLVSTGSTWPSGLPPRVQQECRCYSCSSQVAFMHSCFPMMHLRGAGIAGGNPWRIAQAAFSCRARCTQNASNTALGPPRSRLPTSSQCVRRLQAARRRLFDFCDSWGRLAQACRYVLPLHVYLSLPAPSPGHHWDHSPWLEALRPS